MLLSTVKDRVDIGMTKTEFLAIADGRAVKDATTGINSLSGVALTKDHINYMCDKIIEILNKLNKF